MNIFETYGEEAAKWAYKNALEVHINRPLNSFREKEMIRLASYECPQNYENLLNQIRQIDNQDLQEVVNQIINIENEYRWAGDVDDIIEYQVVPYIMQNLNLESNTYVLLNDYLESYKQKVKCQISTKEAKKIKSRRTHG